MVRGNSPATLDTLRDAGDSTTWVNLNGLWEWESAAEGGPNPPFGQGLVDSILVPFPVESCLSGVPPATSAAVVQSMWCRPVFDATRT